MKEKNTKKKYYIFLDIDGTLYDAAHCPNYDPDYPLLKYFPMLKKSSVNAINTLLEKLEEQFDTQLVITSQRRTDMETCSSYLYGFGLRYNKPLYRTTLDKNLIRGEQILQFMKDAGEGPFNYKKGFMKGLKYVLTKEDFKNFVVIDDEDKNNRLTNVIHKSRIIFSDHDFESITSEQIIGYLDKNNLLSQQQEKYWF